MSAGEVRTCPKKARTPRASSMPLRNAIIEIAAEYERMSLRQLYYQLVSRGVIEKTEAAYKRTADAATQMRFNGSLPYRKIADGSRSRKAVYAHSGLQEALENAHEMYRRNYWIDQPHYVEIWCEKDALTGVIEPVCRAYGVTYVATRGFPSVTLRYESAMEIMATEKPATIFYFGDHDASGQQISTNLEEELRQHGADVTVFRVALNPEQVHAHNLPTRQGKKTDSRQAAFAAQFGDASVELDALPPDALTDLVRESIVSMINPAAWAAAEEVEELERETFRSLTLLNLEAGAFYTMNDGEAA